MKYSQIIAQSLKLKCPECAEGRIFKSYLKLKPSEKCSYCGLDFTRFNIGDAPAYFSIFTVGIIIPLMAILFEDSYSPPLWVHAIIWLPLTFVFCYLTLIYVRSIFIHIEYNYKKPE